MPYIQSVCRSYCLAISCSTLSVFFLQDELTEQWYNVTKRIKENHPAHGHVQPYKWIIKVDGITTTDCPSDKFSELIRNGKKKVCLSQNGPIDPLAQFVKKWGAEKTVTVKEPDFKGKCRLVHFYSKVCSYE